MTIFASFLLGALWCVAAGFFGFSIGKGTNGGEGPAILSALMATFLFFTTIAFLNHVG